MINKPKLIQSDLTDKKHIFINETVFTEPPAKSFCNLSPL